MILMAPNDMLRHTCSPVVKFDAELSDLVLDMEREMITNGGVGLAANQLGYDKRIIVYKDFYSVKHLVNPEILHTSGDNTMLQEGCLSFPGLFVEVSRPSFIIVSGQLVNGNRVTISASGLLSHVIQHEIDHLNGLTIDRFVE